MSRATLQFLLLHLIIACETLTLLLLKEVKSYRKIRQDCVIVKQINEVNEIDLIENRDFNHFCRRRSFPCSVHRIRIATFIYTTGKSIENANHPHRPLRIQTNNFTRPSRRRISPLLPPSSPFVYPEPATLTNYIGLQTHALPPPTMHPPHLRPTLRQRLRRRQGY